MCYIPNLHIERRPQIILWSDMHILLLYTQTHTYIASKLTLSCNIKRNFQKKLSQHKKKKSELAYLCSSMASPTCSNPSLSSLEDSSEEDDDDEFGPSSSSSWSKSTIACAKFIYPFILKVTQSRSLARFKRPSVATSLLQNTPPSRSVEPRTAVIFILKKKRILCFHCDFERVRLICVFFMELPFWKRTRNDGNMEIDTWSMQRFNAYLWVQ